MAALKIDTAAYNSSNKKSSRELPLVFDCLCICRKWLCCKVAL